MCLKISGFITHDGSGDPFPGIIFDEFLVADTTDEDGYYEGVVPDGWSGVLAPKAEDHVFEPRTAFFGNVSADQTQDFTAVPRTVSGFVLHRDTGDPVQGVIMTGFPSIETACRAPSRSCRPPDTLRAKSRRSGARKSG